MHRILALKFAAWLDPHFEVWIFSTIDQIILGHYREMKEATIEQLEAEKEWRERRDQLIRKNPEIAKIFQLELKITAAEKRRIKAFKASMAQLKLEFFRESKE
nr:hypothetical protein [Bacteroidota bacterium]